MLFQTPAAELSTGPGLARLASQQSIGVFEVVSGILSGAVHHVAVRSGSAPSNDDTRCQGGTLRAAGLEMSRMPLESVSSVGVVLRDA